MKITLDEMKETTKLRTMVKKFDGLSDFGKELMFSFMVGYTGATKKEDVYNDMIEQLEKMKGYGE